MILMRFRIISDTIQETRDLVENRDTIYDILIYFFQASRIVSCKIIECTSSFILICNY